MEFFYIFLFLFEDRVTTQAPTGNSSTVNIGAIVAGIFGGILLTILIVLVVYFFKRKRSKKKTLRFTPSISSGRTEMTTMANETIVTPALYNIASSRRESAVSNPGLTYHFYEELP